MRGSTLKRLKRFFWIEYGRAPRECVWELQPNGVYIVAGSEIRKLKKSYRQTKRKLA